MRLHVTLHLQTVFQLTQEPVGLDQLIYFGFLQIALVTKQRQYSYQAACTQLGLSAGADQLQGLADKLDLADTARPQLDIILHALALHLRVDHRLHLADRFKHTEIKITAIDKRCQQRLQISPVIFTAGDQFCLDHGITLPVTPL